MRPRVLNGGKPLDSKVMNKYLNYFKQLLNFKSQDMVSSYQHLLNCDLDMDSPRTRKANQILEIPLDYLFLYNMDSLPDPYDPGVSNLVFEEQKEGF